MTDRETLGGMSHTNPYTGEVFGDTQTYSRGRTVAADGGKADAAPDEAADPETEEESTMADVDHTPRENAPSANAAYDVADAEDEERV